MVIETRQIFVILVKNRGFCFGMFLMFWFDGGDDGWIL